MKATNYDIDRWNETSLTWKPVAHEDTLLEAMARKEQLERDNPEDKYRLRDKTRGAKGAGVVIN